MTKAMLIAAPRSGSGKTSVCRGLVAALAQGLFQDSSQGPVQGFSGRPGQSLTVRAFKMGPDYLDPLHLRAASGSVCHNLDPWMMGEAACLELFRRNTVWACPRPGVAVVEGAMGLFDGGDPASNAGSGAALAKLLGIPVVLVVDVAGQARSVAALVKGFLDFDPELRVAGLILNRAGGPSHAALLRAALVSALPEVPVFGCLPESAGLNLPGRHLGLLPPESGEAGEDGKTAALAAWVAVHLDLSALLAALPDLPDLPAPPGLCGLSPAPGLAEAAQEAGVQIVTGDTKVVPRGGADKIYVNTTGIGRILAHPAPTGAGARPGDAVLVSGPVGDHGMAVMVSRSGLAVNPDLTSDSAPLNHMVENIIAALAPQGAPHVLRDPTRGGLATTLNEIAGQSGVNILLRETDIPVRQCVRAAASIIGLDPLYLACEGRLICIVSQDQAEAALAAMRHSPYGENACRVGEVLRDPLPGGRTGQVVLQTPLGGKRLLPMLEGEQLPRIC